MLYRVKETFKYEPAYGRVDDESKTTVFNKGEIYEFEPYTGRCCKPGEMQLVTKIEPKMNQNWVWRPDYFEENFELVMSELNLVEILKDCPKGTKFYSPLYGDIFFSRIAEDHYAKPVRFFSALSVEEAFYPNGKKEDCYPDAEIMVFPSKENRDWSTFKVEKPKFDVSSLQPFDKVLVRDTERDKWRAAWFSHLIQDENDLLFITTINEWYCCIPYNEDTMHLIGTTNPAPEFYVTWEE